MRDLPRTGLKTMCPAFIGRFSSTVPPGMSHSYFFSSLTPMCSITGLLLLFFSIFFLLQYFWAPQEFPYLFTHILGCLCGLTLCPSSKPSFLTPGCHSWALPPCFQHCSSQLHQAPSVGRCCCFKSLLFFTMVKIVLLLLLMVVICPWLPDYFCISRLITCSGSWEVRSCPIPINLL